MTENKAAPAKKGFINTICLLDDASVVNKKRILTNACPACSLAGMNKDTKQFENCQNISIKKNPRWQKEDDYG